MRDRNDVRSPCRAPELRPVVAREREQAGGKGGIVRLAIERHEAEGGVLASDGRDSTQELTELGSVGARSVVAHDPTSIRRVVDVDLERVGTFVDGSSHELYRVRVVTDDPEW